MQIPEHFGRIVTYIIERARPRSIALCSASVLVLWELGARMLDDGSRDFTVYRLSVLFTSMTIAIMARELSLEFCQLVVDVSMLFPSKARCYSRWKRRAIHDTLTFRSAAAVALMILSITVGIATFFGGQEPPVGFRDYPLYLIHLIPLLFLLGILAYGANLIVGSLISLSNLISIHEQMNCITLWSPEILHLESYFGRLISLSSIGYCSVIASVLVSPYGVTNRTQLVLAVIGFFPLCALVVSVWRLTALRRRIRDQILSILEGNFRERIAQIDAGALLPLIDGLQSTLSSMKIVAGFSTVPFNLSGLLGVTISTAAAVYQFVVIARDNMAP